MNMSVYNRTTHNAQRTTHNAQRLTCGLVILNYIDYHTTISLINIIKDFPELDHIAIVDNASPNDSYQRLKVHESSKISVIQSGRNGGYAFGNNVGVRFLTDSFNVDIIGLANPDVVFDNDFVGTIKRTFEAHPDYSVLAGLQMLSKGTVADYAFHGKDTPSTIFGDEVSELLLPLTLFFCKVLRIKHNRGFKKYIDHKLSLGEPLVQVWAINGCLFFVRTEDFMNESIFDEGTFMYREEEILASRVERMGKKEGVIPSIKFVHLQFHHFSSNRFDLVPRIKSARSFKNSKIYYFNKYVSDNKFLRAVNACLAWLNFFNKSAQAVVLNVFKMAGINLKK